MLSRVITLNGCPGVGKTTLLNTLKTKLINAYIIPEYIDVLPDAQINLDNYLQGKLSAYQFQDYILDYYEEQAKELINSSYSFILVERSPIEGVEIFAKLDWNNHRMTKAEYDCLLERAKSMSFYPNPLLDNESITLYTNHRTPEQLAYLVERYIVEGCNVIKLRASLSVLKSRIHQRGRIYEIEHYTDDYLKTMIKTYQ